MSSVLEQDDLIVSVKSSDDNVFEMPMKAARKSITIRNILTDLGWEEGEQAFPIPSVEGAILEKVIEYLKAHADDPVEEDASKKDEEPSAADQEFLRDMDQSTLFKLILAANFLDIKPLLDLTCKSVADMIKNRSVEEIRQQFNIKNDFTPQEEEQVRRENEWIEDKLA